MKRSLENGLLGITGAATSITSAVYSHMNALVAIMAGLLGLIAAAFACMNGYYTWQHNRKEAAREAKRDEAERAAEKMADDE